MDPITDEVESSRWAGEAVADDIVADNNQETAIDQPKETHLTTLANSAGKLNVFDHNTSSKGEIKLPYLEHNMLQT